MHGEHDEEHPDSDKIDDAAYQIGELCRDNLKDYQRAIRWYECVLAWDSETYGRLFAARCMNTMPASN